MIDWYLILFIAMALLIFHMNDIGEHTEKHMFIRIPGKAKASSGSVSLLSRLLTGTFILLPFYLTIQHGYLAGLLLTLSGTLVLLLFRKNVFSLNEQMAGYESRLDFIRKRFTKKGSWLFGLILIAAGSEGLILSTSFAAYGIKEMFGIPVVWTAFAMLFFCVIFAGIGGAGGIHKIGLWLLMLLFIGMTILPITTILIRGVDTTYERLANLSKINPGSVDLLVISVIFMLFMGGQVLMYYLLSQDLSQLKQSRIQTTIGLSTVCWSAMPLGVTVISLYFMSVTEQTGIAGVLAGLPSALSAPLLYVLIIAFLACFALSIGLSLFRLVSILLTIAQRLTVKTGYAASFLISVVVLLLITFVEPRLDFFILLFLQLFAALCLPLWVLLKSKVTWGTEYSLSIIAAVSCGLWVGSEAGLLWGTLVSTLFPVIIIGVIFIRKIRTV